MAKKKETAPVVEADLSSEEIEDLMYLANRKVRNPKKALQEEGRQAILDLNERLKRQSGRVIDQLKK